MLGAMPWIVVQSRRLSLWLLIGKWGNMTDEMQFQQYTKVLACATGSPVRVCRDETLALILT